MPNTKKPSESNDIIKSTNKSGILRERATENVEPLCVEKNEDPQDSNTKEIARKISDVVPLEVRRKNRSVYIFLKTISCIEVMFF